MGGCLGGSKKEQQDPEPSETKDERTPLVSGKANSNDNPAPKSNPLTAKNSTPHAKGRSSVNPSNHDSPSSKKPNAEKKDEPFNWDEFWKSEESRLKK